MSGFPGRAKPSQLAAVGLGVLMAVLVAGQGLAQTPLPEDPLDDRSAKRIERMEKVVRELRSIVFQGRDSGKPVIVQPTDTDARIAQLVEQVRDLESSLTRVNGDNERLSIELQQLRRDQDASRTELNELTARLAAQTPLLPAPDVTAAASLRAPSPAQDFESANGKLLAGDFAGAARDFQTFIQAYPDNSRLAEARYRLGDALQVQGDHSAAAQAYLLSIRAWPATAWAPTALVKLAHSLTSMSQTEDACGLLAELPRRYPAAVAGLSQRVASERARARCPK